MATTTTTINTIDEGLVLREYDLYQNGDVIVFPNGEKELQRKPIVYIKNIEDAYHPVKKGERLTQIAYENYKDVLAHPQFYWWIIADANEIENPFDISYLVGQDILIPAWDEFKRQYNNAENLL